MPKKSNKTRAEKEERVRQAQQELAEAMWDLLPDGTFAEREQAILDLTEKSQRELTRRDLQKISDSVGERVRVDGKTYKRYHSATVRYHSLGGALPVARDSYREEGVRNGPTIVPLELLAGLAHRATPALARSIVHGYARHDMRTHGEILTEAHRSPPSRATLERIAKALAETAASEVVVLENLAFGQDDNPQQVVGLSIGLDRVSVPMAEVLPEPVTKPRRPRRKPYVRAVPKPIEINWRMAYVGTVSWLDEHGEAIGVVRYAAPATDDPRSLTARMHHEVYKVLQQSPGLKVAVVQDGAPEMWTLARELLQSLKELGTVASWSEAIDLPHLMSRLGAAAGAVMKDCSPVVESWKRKLLECDNTIDVIEMTLKRQVPTSTVESASILKEHLTYIENNKDRMRYATVRAAGLPIGSGVTESTAKTVVNLRAKRSGQRWSVPGLRGVLTLRALLQSNRLGRLWEELSERYIVPVTRVPMVA